MRTAEEWEAEYERLAAIGEKPYPDEFARMVQAEAYAAGRAAGLEEAAKVAAECDLYAGDFLRNSDPRQTCAAAIRELIPRPADDTPASPA